MRERAKRASASELGTVYFNQSLLRLVWTAARPVATIVYIIIFDRIECFYSFTHLLTITRERAKRASAPETHIFMPQKCDISAWPKCNSLCYYC